MSEMASVIKHIIKTHEKYHGCFFWDAKEKSAKQKKEEEFNNEYVFQWASVRYNVRQSLTISNNKYYYRMRIESGGKLTNIDPIKKILAELEKINFG